MFDDLVIPVEAVNYLLPRTADTCELIKTIETSAVKVLDTQTKSLECLLDKYSIIPSPENENKFVLMRDVVDREYVEDKNHLLGGYFNVISSTAVKVEDVSFIQCYGSVETDTEEFLYDFDLVFNMGELTSIKLTELEVRSGENTSKRRTEKFKKDMIAKENYARTTAGKFFFWLSYVFSFVPFCLLKLHKVSTKVTSLFYKAFLFTNKLERNIKYFNLKDE